MVIETTLLAVALVSLIAVISPGPDFCIVLKNSLVYSRKAGFWTAIGISSALLIHLTYTLFGVGALIGQSTFLFHFLQYAGALYLLYLGLKGIISSFKKSRAMDVSYETSNHQISSQTALKQGFFTNMLNPKCALFFISLFSQFMTPETSLFLKVQYGLINWSITLIWFLFLSYLVTAPYIMSRIDRFRKLIDRIMGFALITLSLKLLFV